MYRNVSRQIKKIMFTEHAKKYSYGNKTKHDIAMLLASDLAAQTSNHLHHRSKYYQFHVV